MRKVVKIGFILFSVICMLTVVYAASCVIGLQTAKNEFDKGEEFVVDVTLSNIEVERGIIALEGVLEYDKNNLTLVKMEGQNTWSTPINSLSYNEATGKLVLDRGGLATSDEVALKITFKVKETNSESAAIALKDISVSNGTEDIAVPNATKTIAIKTTTPTPNPGDNNNSDDNNNGNNNNPDNGNNNGNNNPTGGNNNNNGNDNSAGGNNNNNGNNNPASGNNNNNGSNNPANGNSNNNNSNKSPNTNNNTNRTPIKIANTSDNSQTDSVKQGILPKTGEANRVLIILGGMLILVVFFYVKMKTIDRNMKSK